MADISYTERNKDTNDAYRIGKQRKVRNYSNDGEEVWERQNSKCTTALFHANVFIFQFPMKTD